MSMPSVNLLRCLSLFAVLLLSGCSFLLPASPKVIDTLAETKATALPLELTQMFTDALALLRDEKFVEAETLLLQIINEYPNYSGPWTNLAIAQLSLEKFDDSLLSINNSLVIDQDFCPALSLKGVVLRELGEFKKAKSAYLKAIECDPSDATNLYNLGVLSDLYLHDEASALFYYERYLISLNEAQGESDNTKDSTVESWVVGLKRRVPEGQRIVIVAKKEKSETKSIAISNDNIKATATDVELINNESDDQQQLAGEE